MSATSRRASRTSLSRLSGNSAHTRRSGWGVSPYLAFVFFALLSCTDGPTAPISQRVVLGDVTLSDSSLSKGSEAVANVVAPVGYAVVDGSVAWSTSTPDVVTLVGAADRGMSVTVRATGVGALDLRASFLIQAKGGAPSSTIGGPATARTSIATGSAAVGTVHVQAPALVFASAPAASVAAGADMGVVRVELQDAAGRVLSGLTDSVFVSIDPTSGTPGAALVGVRRVRAEEGVAIFTGLSVQRAGAGYRLLATSPSVVNPAAATFTVTPGAPDPSTSTIAVASNTIAVGESTVATVTLRDAFGNIVTTAGTAAFTVSATGGSLGSLSCVAGVCTGNFTSLVAGPATVSASIGGIAISGSPAGITVTAGAAAYFGISGANSQLAGTMQVITVTAYDQYGNVAESYIGDKSVVFLGASPAPIGTMPSTAPAGMVGIHAGNLLGLTPLSVDFGNAVRLAFVLGATRAELTLYRSESALLSVTEGAISTPVAGQLPVDVIANAPSSVQSRVFLERNQLEPGERTLLTLEIFDAWGNPINDINGSDVSLVVSLGSLGPVTCSLNVCTAEYTAVSVGTETLTANIGGAGLGAEPVEVEIEVVQVPVTLEMVTPASGARSDLAFATQPVLQILDKNGQRVLGSDAVVTMTVTAGVTVIGSSAVVVRDGVATFTNVGLRGLVGEYTLTFTTVNLAAVTQPIALSAGDAAALRITGSAAQVAGTTQTVTLAAFDAQGNVATGYTGAKALTFSGATLAPDNTSPTAAGTDFGAATPVTFTNGAATVPMTLYAVELAEIDATDGTISAAGNMLDVSVTSSAFLNVSLTGPASTLVNTEAVFILTARDVYGNVASPTSAVAFNLTSSLAGTYALTPVTIPVAGSTVAVYFTPTAQGQHTLTATQASGGVATASAPLTAVGSDPVSTRVVCTESQSGGSSSAERFTANLCETNDPANTRQVGDLQFVTVALQPSNGSTISGVTFTPPAGWTLLGTRSQGPVQSWVFYKRHVAGDPAAVTFASSSKNKWVIDMITYRASGTSIPVFAAATSTTNTVTAPALAAPAANSIVYYNVASNNSTVRYTTPTGLTARTTNSVGGSANSMFGFDRAAEAGAIAPASFTTVSGTGVNAVLIAITFGP
jgi:hypothetical protein